jgi:hypothetical protein
VKSALQVPALVVRDGVVAEAHVLEPQPPPAASCGKGPVDTPVDA